MFAQCRKEGPARVRLLDAARLVDMTRKEEAREAEGVLHRNGIAAQAGATPEKSRQRQHPVAPGSPASRETALPDFGET